LTQRPATTSGRRLVTRISVWVMAGTLEPLH
jgi:hypothetical protein